LASEQVYQSALVLFKKANMIENPGPRLSNQLTRLKQHLKEAITPIPVRLQSDNLSMITLYKVATFGQFSQRNIELKPGNYTIIAAREGFRDVRKEFSVKPGNTLVTVSIQCEEKI
jgi:hypothetical protein